MSENKNINPYSHTVSRGHVHQEYHEEIDEPDTVVVRADALKCPTCFEFFRDSPVMLACGHSFCQRCMTKLTEIRVTRVVRCPMCRQECSGAAKNYAVGQIVDSTDSHVERLSPSQAAQNLKFKNEQLREENSHLRSMQKEEETSPWVTGAIGAVVGAIGVGLVWALSSGSNKRRNRND
ncbi:hypothetical protein QR680_013826 [Steinernema hermaphroditum]|uniref:RING-type domain-containing protein n=1 Tax=Steinernema hermaphroditum TaxID=289476 RepID=A0AA39I6T9_9BILA|nr:hypothetical protein QR680_013826 [Steinernema hermaphroditum]